MQKAISIRQVAVTKHAYEWIPIRDFVYQATEDLVSAALGTNCFVPSPEVAESNEQKSNDEAQNSILDRFVKSKPKTDVFLQKLYFCLLKC